LLLSFGIVAAVAAAGCAAETAVAPEEQSAEDNLSISNLYHLVRGDIDRSKVDPFNPWAKTQLGIGEEFRVPGEAEEFGKFAALVNAVAKDAKEKSGATKLARTFHAKPHACIKGELQISNNDMPAEARVGLFAQNKSYPTWTRFSNGVGERQADGKLDIRGLAIKVMGVPGARMVTSTIDGAATTQDFLMANQPVAPASDARHMMAFAEASMSVTQSTTILGRIENLIPVGKFLTRDENVRIVDFLANMALPKNKALGSILGDSFFTAVPNALGLEAGDPDTARAKGAFKMMVKTGVLRGDTCTPLTEKPNKRDADYLRTNLEKHLAEESVCIDVFLQFQTDPKREPIEDGSVIWKSPFVKAGRITFKPQTLADAEQQACDSFSFQPWHTLQDHRPLGNVMRARRIALPSSAAYRGADTVEPKP
jgi:hypothetical protein